MIHETESSKSADSRGNRGASLIFHLLAGKPLDTMYETALDFLARLWPSPGNLPMPTVCWWLADKNLSIFSDVGGGGFEAFLFPRASKRRAVLQEDITAISYGPFCDNELVQAARQMLAMEPVSVCCGILIFSV